MLLNVFTTIVTQWFHTKKKFFLVDVVLDEISHTFWKSGTNWITNPSDGSRSKLSIFTEDLPFISNDNSFWKTRPLKQVTAVRILLPFRVGLVAADALDSDFGFRWDDNLFAFRGGADQRRGFGEIQSASWLAAVDDHEVARTSLADPWKTRVEKNKSYTISWWL